MASQPHVPMRFRARPCAHMQDIRCLLCAKAVTNQVPRAKPGFCAHGTNDAKICSEAPLHHPAALRHPRPRRMPGRTMDLELGPWDLFHLVGRTRTTERNRSQLRLATPALPFSSSSTLVHSIRSDRDFHLVILILLLPMLLFLLTSLKLLLPPPLSLPSIPTPVVRKSVPGMITHMFPATSFPPSLPLSLHITCFGFPNSDMSRAWPGSGTPPSAGGGVSKSNNEWAAQKRTMVRPRRRVRKREGRG